MSERDKQYDALRTVCNRQLEYIADLEQLFQALAEDYGALEKELAEMQKLQVRIYNAGYEAGHNDTVESVFCPIHPSDMDTLHADVVAEIVADAAIDRGGEGCQ